MAVHEPFYSMCPCCYCLLQYKDTHCQLSSLQLYLLGESERQSSVNLCQGSLYQDKENETGRGERLLLDYL